MAVIKPSLVDVHLGMAASDIATSRQKMTEVRASVASINTALSNIPTKYANMIETVNAYGTGDVAEAYCKAQLARLTAEFVALQSAVAEAQAALTSGVTEF